MSLSYMGCLGKLGTTACCPIRTEDPRRTRLCLIELYLIGVETDPMAWRLLIYLAGPFVRCELYYRSFQALDRYDCAHG